MWPAPHTETSAPLQRESNGPAPGLIDPDEWFCPDCGYDLRGTQSDRCPECGLVVDRTGPPPARVPWEHRRHLGRARAWWRTVRLATFAPSRLAADVLRPVRYRDAQRFRVVTSLLAGLMLGGVLLAGQVAYGAAGFLNDALVYEADLAAGADGRLRSPDLRIPWEAGVCLPGVQPAAAVLFMLLAAGAASYGFHPRALPVERQNAAVALSHYAAAPFLFLPLPFACAATAMMLDDFDPDDLAPLFVLLALVSAVFGAFVLFHVPLTRLRLATRAGWLRVVLAAVWLPVAWLLSAAAAFGALPWVVGFVQLVVGSLR